MLREKYWVLPLRRRALLALAGISWRIGTDTMTVAAVVLWETDPGGLLRDPAAESRDLIVTVGPDVGADVGR